MKPCMLQDIILRIWGKRIFFFEMILFSFLLLMFLPTSHAWGIEWVDLATTSDGNTLSYDKNSIRKTGTDTYRLWERIIYADKNVQDNIKTTIFVREINCQTNQHRIISVIDYTENGENVFSGADNMTDWFVIPTGSFVNDLKNIICVKKAPN